MRRTKSSWTEADYEKLKGLVAAGASPYRAAIALGRAVSTVKDKARKIGCPFPNLQLVKAKTHDISGIRRR
jgi:hypothetical protein